jgi:hypothetical protein
MRRGQERYRLNLEVYEKLFGEKPSDRGMWADHVDVETPGEQGGSPRSDKKAMVLQTRTIKKKLSNQRTKER